MTQISQTKAADRVLDLRSLLVDLQRDGLITDDEVEKVASSHRSREQAAMHPLNFIASLELENQLKPGTVVDIDTLIHWLAAISISLSRVARLPVSSRTSQRTPAGCNPASRARSTAASV